MAVSIANQWQTGFGDTDGELVANPTTGRMLIACIVSRVIDGSTPTLAIGDVSRNGWTLLSDPFRFASVPHVAAQLQVEVWGCPSARYDGWPFQLIYASAMQITASDVGSVAVNVAEIAGTTGQITVDSVTTATATASTTLAMTAPAPTGGANVLQVAAVVADSGTAATPSGTGWTALTASTNVNPVVGLASAWREATTTGTVTFTLGTSQSWAGVIVALKTAGTVLAQPNAAWPATSLQIGLGYDLSTPLSRVRWTDQTTRYLSLNSSRGIQAELGAAQAGQAVLKLRNSDGAYSPRPVATAATANAAGTTTTIKMADASAASIHVADFFRIRRAALNTNTGFESGTTGWTPTGGTLTTTTSIVQSGGAAGQMTPDGVTGNVRVDQTLHVPVTAGAVYTASGWMRCAVARVVSLNCNWYDAGAAYITTTGNDVSVPANTWVFMSADFVAPAGAATGNIIPTLTGTPPASNVFYMDDIIFKAKDELDVFQVTGLASAGGTTTVTFKRADGTAGGSRALTAAGDVYAGIAIDLYIPWRLLHTVAGITYTVASGWLKDLPLAFEDAHYSTVQAQGADAVETLSASNPSVLSGEIMRRSPYAYWPCDDSNGVTYAANASGVSNTPLVQTKSKYGAGSMTAAFGASTQAVPAVASPVISTLLGDAGTGWAQSGGVAADLATKGYALVGSDPNFPPISGGVTIVGAVFATDLNPIAAATADPTICIIRNADPAAGIGQGSVIKVSIDRVNLTPKVTVWDKSTHATTTVTGTGKQIAGSWYLWALTFNQTSWAMYNGGFGLSASGSCNLVANWSGIDVGGEADQFNHSRFFSAVHAHVAVYGRRLTAQEIANMGYAAWQGTPSNELSSARASRKLNTVGYRGTRVVNSSVIYDSIEDTPSGTVVDLLSTLASWEDSTAFADAASQTQFRANVTAYQQKPVATLGDGPGEIPYQPGQTYDYNTAYLYAQTSVENTSVNLNNAAVGTSTLVAIDDTSAAKYPGKTLALATRLQRVSDAWHLGWWLLARYAYPRQRVGTITVSAAATADTARWAFVCGIEVGDILTINRRPIGQPAISIRCKVLSVSPTFDRTTDPAIAQVTLTLAAAPFIVPIANDATYGVVGGTVLGA